uniref:hypothetical protein n=1 Tax=Acinetobacter baumannii TaxID=470 RepID=UPI001BB32CEB
AASDVYKRQFLSRANGYKSSNYDLTQMSYSLKLQAKILFYRQFIKFKGQEYFVINNHFQ